MGNDIAIDSFFTLLTIDSIRQHPKYFVFMCHYPQNVQIPQ